MERQELQQCFERQEDHDDRRSMVWMEPGPHALVWASWSTRPWPVSPADHAPGAPRHPLSWLTRASRRASRRGSAGVSNFGSHPRRRGSASGNAGGGPASPEERSHDWRRHAGRRARDLRLRARDPRLPDRAPPPRGGPRRRLLAVVRAHPARESDKDGTLWCCANLSPRSPRSSPRHVIPDRELDASTNSTSQHQPTSPHQLTSPYQLTSPHQPTRTPGKQRHIPSSCTSDTNAEIQGWIDEDLSFLPQARITKSP